jgi:hypothetical protein
LGTGVGKSSSIKLVNIILFETPWATKPTFADQKISTKSEFYEFTSMEKCTQLLLIECIWQSQKFDKPSLK